MYEFLANTVLVVHVGFVVFIVVGLVLILAGGYLNWNWVHNLWFRLCHLLGIGIVVIQAWSDVVCSLTRLEMWLRLQAGSATYAGSFVQYWLQRLLYYQAPSWVFILLYSVFGGIVLLSWWIVPPRYPVKRKALPDR